MASPGRNRISNAAVVAIAAGLLAWSWDDLEPLWRGILVALGVFLSLAFLIRSRTPDGGDTHRSVVELLDTVVADETRRPWAPTTLPWTTPEPSLVLLVAAADYHLAELVPLAAELNRGGLATRIAVGASPWARTWQALSSYPGLEVHALPEPEDIAGRAAAVVVMKDTGSLGPFVERCRQLGIPTLGKVEGAQDFWDADTPEERRPYRNLDLVMCQGQFDVEALDDRDTEVVGSTRLERLWWAPSVQTSSPLALINLNFVYGVGTSDRKLWLESAISGCQKAGIDYVISIHPAEKARPESSHVTSISASRLLPHTSVLISRFSTMPFEAMARGVPFVYHNPHGESVKTFADPMAAFDVTTSGEELAKALTALNSAVDSRSRSERYFTYHVSTEASQPSEKRAAEAIIRLIGSAPA